MGTSYPKLNIAAFGMEKIVPDLDALGVFTRLLARSATGQPVTTYTLLIIAVRVKVVNIILLLWITAGYDPFQARPYQDIKLYPLRCLYEYLSGLSPKWRILLHLLYTRPYRYQSGMAHDPEKYYDKSFRLLLVYVLF